MLEFKSRRRRLRSGGLTLIELMISILLGSFLSLAISKVYLSGIRNHVATEEMARLADNGRFSLTLLKRELMSAGFYGALPTAHELIASAVSGDCSSVGNWALDPRDPLDFINNVQASSQTSLRSTMGITFTCLQATDIISGTDILSVKRTAGNYTLQNGAYQGNAVSKSNRWYLRVADYGEQKNWVYHRSGGFPSGDTGVATGVDYWEYYARIFYIRKFSQDTGDGIPTLCVESLGGGGSLGAMATRCLVEGVEDMQIEFGLDRNFDGTADEVRDEMQPPDLQNAVFARIFLLMRSVGKLPGTGRSRTYSLGTKQVLKSDGYVRRVMTTTVYMPNVSRVVS